jgi:hypothetical protein
MDFHTYFSIVSHAIGVIANIFELSLISIIKSSRTNKLFSRTYINRNGAVARSYMTNGLLIYD